MSISEHLGNAAKEIENAADEACRFAKEKYEETVTPEKRAEIKEKFDKGMKAVDDTMNTAAEKIENGIKGFVDGFNSKGSSK